MTSKKTLIENIGILTGDPSAEYMKDSSIGIEDDRILFIARPGELPADFVPDKKINGRRKLAIPGLVNAHTHCGMTLMRNAADDLPLHKWLFERIFIIEDKLTDEDVYWGTLLGAAEMIRSGTTAAADMYLHMEAAARAFVETGMKVNISMSPLLFQSEGGFRAIDMFDEVRDYHRQWNGKAEGRIKVYVEVHSTYLFDMESLKRSSELAKELNTGIHIHLLETVKEREESFEKHGKTPIEICIDTGITDVPVIGAHLVHLSEDDIRMLKETGINAAHNPTSNLKLGSGISPVADMLAAGINVALGTDGTASNNNLNMIEEMHLTALIHKGVARNPELVSARQVFMMGTANGTRALGFGDETGVLKAGAKADIVILDIDKAHFYPLNDPYSALVYSAQGGDVETVLVDGDILMENRELKLIDEEKVKFEADAIAARIC